MVHFTEHILSGKMHLVILTDRDQSIKNELSFLMQGSLAGSFANFWSNLDNNMILSDLSAQVPLT